MSTCTRVTLADSIRYQPFCMAQEKQAPIAALRLPLGRGVDPPGPLSLDNLGREQGLLPGHGRQVEAERAVVPVNRDGMG